MKQEVKLKVTKEQELLSFLLSSFPELSRKKVKEILGSGKVFVNGRSITQFNQVLKEKDEVIISTYKSSKKKKLPFVVLDEDKNIIVVSKPSGLLTVSTEKEKEKTLYHEVSSYVKKQNPKNKIFVVHRLDKDTSGIVLFAKNEKVKELYQDKWEQLVLLREYIAVVEGKVLKKHGVIRSYLLEDNTYFVHSTSNKKKGQLAITEYEVMKYQDGFTWLKIHLKTGRKNQIRVHMSEMGHSIVGDKKYGSKKNPYHRLLLHANKLVVLDPITGKKREWSVEAPSVMQ